MPDVVRTLSSQVALLLVLEREIHSRPENSDLAIIVDDHVLLAPRIMSAVGSPAMIEGTFSQSDMIYLAQRLAP